MTKRTRLHIEALENRCVPATMLHPDLDVRPVVTGLARPITMAFLGDNEFLILEKDTGMVKHVVNGAVHGTVLDLPVNNFQQRGLLGIALHPDFFGKEHRGDDDDRDERDHGKKARPYVYLSWTESSTGADSTGSGETALLGNRLDRFIWNGAALQFDRTLMHTRAYQDDAVADPAFWGRHQGGPIAFGPDGKLYYFLGDTGRRGWLQNNLLGPDPDDNFGGPEPDDAHLTGVILRLNDDGSTPRDNPFYKYGRELGGEVGANLQMVYAYGMKNSFGMAFDPYSGRLWDAETGDDSFTELNRVEPGQNSGWVQLQGPVERFSEFRAIENSGLPSHSPGFAGELRYPASRIAATPEEALSRLYVLPGSHYSDPEFSWKFEIPVAGIGFVDGRGLGKEFAGDLFTGGALPLTAGGHLFHFDLNANRKELAFDDPRLADKVADNLRKHDITESESLLIGRDFGVLTHILTGPNGNLYVVSISQGTVFEIFRKTPTVESGDVTDQHAIVSTPFVFTFTVTLSAAYDQPVTMSFRTVNGTATTSDGDYIAKTGTLTFAPGETTKTITIEIKGDSKREADETFYLDLFGNSSNWLFTNNRTSARS